MNDRVVLRKLHAFKKEIYVARFTFYSIHGKLRRIKFCNHAV